MADAFNFPGDLADYPDIVPGTATLDGRVYVFRFWPQTRADDGRGAWCVDLLTATLVPVLLAVKVVISDDLFGDYRTIVDEVPPGRVVVRRTDARDEEPRPTRKGEIGARVATLGSPLLVVEYVPAAEG